MSLNEKILVCELKKGNSKAYELLFFHYFKKLYNFSYKITRDTQESEDLVQDVFISVWNSRDKLDENRSFSGFVFKIARNKALNLIKQKLTRQIYSQYTSNEESLQGNSDIEAQEFSKIINASISSLPEKTKEIFLLSRNEGLTYIEISQKLNISENIVDHEIRKALKKIKEILQSMDYF